MNTFYTDDFLTGYSMICSKRPEQEDAESASGMTSVHMDSSATKFVIYLLLLNTVASTGRQYKYISHLFFRQRRPSPAWNSWSHAFLSQSSHFNLDWAFSGNSDLAWFRLGLKKYIYILRGYCFVRRRHWQSYLILPWW